MSRRKIARGQREKLTVFYDHGKKVMERPASSSDKDWTSKTKSYIRISSTTPKKK